MRLVIVSNDFKCDKEQESCSNDDIMYVDCGMLMEHENGMVHTIYFGGSRTICEKINNPSRDESSCPTSHSKGEETRTKGEFSLDAVASHLMNFLDPLQ